MRVLRLPEVNIGWSVAGTYKGQFLEAHADIARLLGTDVTFRADDVASTRSVTIARADEAGMALAGQVTEVRLKHGGGTFYVYMEHQELDALVHGSDTTIIEPKGE